MLVYLRAIAVVLSVAVLAPAQAASKDGVRAGYYDICVKTADLIKPEGGRDLKASAKPQTSCACSPQPYVERPLVAFIEAQSRKSAPLADLPKKEELASRNVCRGKTDLTAAAGPN
jgi:hypothetical protein